MLSYVQNLLRVAGGRAGRSSAAVAGAALLLCIVAVFCSPAADGRGRQPVAGRTDGALLARQGISPPGGLQPGTIPRPVSTTGDECLRRRADWEKNRPAWSFLWGAVFYVIFVVLLTFLRVTRSGVRLLISFVAAVIFGSSLLALQVQDALKVCPSPPGFLGSVVSAPILMWTGTGGVIAILAAFAIRYVTVVLGRFRRETTTP